MRCKGVRANNENRKDLRFQVKIELSFDPSGPLLGLSPQKTRIDKTQAGIAALHPYSQYPRNGSNQNVPQQTNAQEEVIHVHNGILTIENSEILLFAAP